MADVEVANRSFLEGKWGPLPVWLWGAIGLVIAYLINKYRSSQADKAAAKQPPATQTADLAAPETQAVAPQFIIEENQAPSYNTQTVTGVAGPAGPAGPVGPAGPAAPSVPVNVPAPPAKVPAPPISTPPSKTTPPKAKPPIEYRVPQDSGESFSSIAKKFGYKAGGQALYQYQITSSPHSATAKREIQARGPNLLYGNELVYIPQQ